MSGAPFLTSTSFLPDLLSILHLSLIGHTLVYQPNNAHPICMERMAISRTNCWLEGCSQSQATSFIPQTSEPPHAKLLLLFHPSISCCPSRSHTSLHSFVNPLETPQSKLTGYIVPLEYAFIFEKLLFSMAF